MKKILVTLFIISTTLITFSQIQPTKASINDFATQAFYKYKYGNGVFVSTMNLILSRKGYSSSGCAIVMENLKTDKKGREAVFAGIANLSGDMESLFRNFYSMEMTAKNANDLAYYVYETYSKERFEKRISIEKPDSISSTPIMEKYFPRIFGSRKIIKSYPFAGDLDPATVYAVVKVSPAGTCSFAGFGKNSTTKALAYSTAITKYLQNVLFEKSSDESTVIVQFNFSVL